MILTFGDPIQDFSPGYRTQGDPSALEPGACQAGSQNVVISDGDLIEPRKGFTLFGTDDSSGERINSAYTFIRRHGGEVPVRASGTVIEYWNDETLAFENLITGLASARIVGFTQLWDNDLYQDQFFMCNGVDSDMMWDGVFSQLDGALVGAETEIVVNSVLTETIHDSNTASASTDTTITIASSAWGTDIWNDLFYVYITAGTHVGKIARITDSDATSITFSTITGLSGTVTTFEIRQNKFAHSGTVHIGTTDIAYTSLSHYNTFAGCTGTPAAADDAAISQAVSKYPGNPRGFMTATLNGRRLIVGTDSSTVYASHIFDGTDFTYSGPRAAGEGDVILVEGDGPIYGLGIFGGTAFAVKKSFIKKLVYTEDGTDVLNSESVESSPNCGTVSPLSIVQADNNLFLASPVDGIKTLSRVENIENFRLLQIADAIRPDMERGRFNFSAGFFWKNKLYMSMEEEEDSTDNDIVQVYNFAKSCWEPPLVGLNISSFFPYQGELHGASSVHKKCYKLFTELDDYYDGSEATPIAAAWYTPNFTFGSALKRKAFTCLYVEGYIAENDEIEVELRYEYEGVSDLITGSISGTNEAILFTAPTADSLGLAEMATLPLASGEDEESEGAEEARSKFRVYLTTTEKPFYECSLVFRSESLSPRWKILRYAFNTVELNEIDPSLKVKMN